MTAFSFEQDSIYLVGKPPLKAKVCGAIMREDPVETSPSLELNNQPSHLKYAFLGESSQLPVTIYTEQTEEQKNDRCAKDAPKMLLREI